MRSRTARLATALLVGVAGWATGGPYGQGQSAGRRTTSPEAATAFGWRLPDWMPPPPVPPDNPMSAAKVELGIDWFGEVPYERVTRPGPGEALEGRSTGARTLFNRLAEQGILVRAFIERSEWLRIGLADDHGLARLSAALDAIRTAP